MFRREQRWVSAALNPSYGYLMCALAHIFSCLLCCGLSDYRRNFVPGGTFFFTVNLADRRSRQLIDSIDALRGAFRSVRALHPFTVDAVVIMPDHLHAIWTLPPGDADYSMRWRLIKAAFSHAMTH